MMMNQAEALRFCGEWLPAWTGNRPEALMAYYAGDAFYLDPAKPEGLRGHGQMLPYFRKLLAANPDWRWRALEAMPTERGFTLKWEALVPLQGENLTIRGLDVVEIADGKITRNEVYFDRAEWIARLKK